MLRQLLRPPLLLVLEFITIHYYGVHAGIPVVTEILRWKDGWMPGQVDGGKVDKRNKGEGEMSG